MVSRQMVVGLVAKLLAYHLIPLVGEGDTSPYQGMDLKSDISPTPFRNLYERKKSAWSFVKNLRARILKFLLDVDDLTDHFLVIAPVKKAPKKVAKKSAPKKAAPKKVAKKAAPKKKVAAKKAKKWDCLNLSI